MERCRDMERDRDTSFMVAGALKSLLSTRPEEIQVMTFTWPSQAPLCSPLGNSHSSRREQFTFREYLQSHCLLNFYFSHISLEQRSFRLWYGCSQYMKLSQEYAGMDGETGPVSSARTRTFPKPPCLNTPKLEMPCLPSHPLPGKILSLEKESL